MCWKGRHRWRGDAGELEPLEVIEELSLCGSGERAANLVDGTLQGLLERQEAETPCVGAERDEDRGLPGREIDRGERIRAIEREPSATPALRGDGQGGVAERVEVTVDRAYAHPESIRERLRGHPRFSRAQVLGKGEQAALTAHRGLRQI